MSILYPLGLIALASIIILIIIYLIKPNYQNKFISSTFIWKLSLKYKRKKITSSKLRNLLLILCQVLILTLFSLLLAYPIIKLNQKTYQEETIIIVDSSASMRTTTNNTTRYERALDMAKIKSQEILNNDGLISLIIADNNPTIVCQNISSSTKDELYTQLDSLISTAEINCSYTSNDINEAIELSNTLLVENPNSSIIIYTDKDFNYIPDKVKVEKVYDASEWNDAIIDAYTEYNNNYYDIIVELAAYGRDKEVNIRVDVNGANTMDKNDTEGKNYTFTGSISCYSNTISKIIFKSNLEDNDIYQSDNVAVIDLEKEERIYSYKSILISIDNDNEDSYILDNSFCIYGGQKEVIKIQYSSSLANTFVRSVLNNLKNIYSDSFDIQITEEKKGNPELTGYDYYIFEHSMPSILPTDGVCLLFDPTSSTNECGFKYSGVVNYSKIQMPLTANTEIDSSLLYHVNVDEIIVTQIDYITDIDPQYQILAYVDNYPALMVKNDGKSKVFVMNFSIHYSNLSILNAFPFLFKNIFDYFTPNLIDSNSYKINDEIKFNTRGEKIYLTTPDSSDDKIEFTEFPASYIANEPGTYKAEQTTDFEKNIEELFFVRTPKEESNIFSIEESITNPYYEKSNDDIYKDIAFYFAIAAVTLIFFEWWLKNRDKA